MQRNANNHKLIVTVEVPILNLSTKKLQFLIYFLPNVPKILASKPSAGHLVSEVNMECSKKELS